MSRAALVSMTRRTLTHVHAGTVPLAESVRLVPAAHYRDPVRWEQEIERIFHRVPLVVGFSAELDEPGAYKAIELAGFPVLLTRGDDGEIRAFVNSCSHRGAIVVPEGCGRTRRFSCPYHSWTYDGDGTLVGILDRSEFGDLDVDSHGLTRLPVAERAGLVFTVLQPVTCDEDRFLDVDAFLCGYGELLDQLGLTDCRFVGSQQVDGPNWKIAYDGYLDFYHLPILHRESFGADTSNKAIYDAWGPHQRVSSPEERLLSLEERDEDDWPVETLAGGVWTIFPHTSIASFKVRADGVDGGGLIHMVSTLYPGADVGSSVTVQSFLAAFEPSEELAPAIDAQRSFLLGVVRDEDYRTGFGIQRALRTGAKHAVLFGRNEAGGQRFHRWVDNLVAAETQDALAALYAAGQVVHQP